MKDRRLRDLQRQRRIQAERAAERRPVKVRRCLHCNAKLNSWNDNDWCSPCLRLRAKGLKLDAEKAS